MKTFFAAFVTFAMLALVLGTAVTSCYRYDVPEFAEIGTSETGFLIPLEGDTKTQEVFASESYLRERKVATKRVQITHRWVQEGRAPWSGRYMGTVRLVKVNRSPITREWTADEGRGTTGKDQAIWVESADSVGFSMGFTATAFIAEDHAANFLYWYPTGSLEQVMDTEVRARIQQAVAEVAAKYPLDKLRALKQQMSDAAKRDVIDFFTPRGITVTTIGMFGGMAYENPDIQKSIDRVFIDQQLKESEKAKLEAQASTNQRLREEGEGMASRAREVAKGEADAIREVTKAINEAQQNPLYLQLKSLDVEKARIERWNGEYPNYLLTLGGGASPGPTLQVALPGAVIPPATTNAHAKATSTRALPGAVAGAGSDPGAPRR